MKTYAITVQSKETQARAKDIRSNKRVPGVIYGSGQKNTPITCNAKELRDLFAQAGHSNIIDVNIEGAEKPVKAIIHDLQFNPIADEIIHIDFYAIDMKKKITTNIPIKLVGISEAVKTLGGMLITNKDELSIKCLPGDLIPFIEADISLLKEFHDTIKVKDLDIPENIEVLEEEERTIAHVEEPRVQTAEEEAETTEEAVEEGEKKEETEEREEEKKEE